MTETPALSAPPKRPTFVTFLMAILVIQGVAGILLGVFLVVDRNDENLLRQINENELLENHQLTSDHLLTIGIIGMVLGVVLVILALMLANGSNFVRWLLVLGSLGNAAYGLHSLVALHGEQQMSGSLTVVFSAMAIWLLVANDESEEFFGR